MSDNNEKKPEGPKPPKMPQLTPKQMEKQASINVFIKEFTFFTMHQVGIVIDGEISVKIPIEDGSIRQFSFDVTGKRVCKVPEEKKDG